MNGSDNLRAAKEKALERVLLGTALATLAGYIGLAIAILRHKEPEKRQQK
jgi:hypothetical protein